jgi:heterodisulfide reductase subunit C/nitrate reductase gamma subunit
MDVLLIIAFLIFLAGLGWRLFTWFGKGFNGHDTAVSTGRRIGSALSAVGATISSGRLLKLVRSLFVDVLFQRRLLAKSSWRWAAHGLLFIGFIGLLLMHGLGYSVSTFFFSNYESTLQPFLGLREFFGVLVVIGVGLAIYRRFTDHPKRVRSYASDWLALFLVGGIIISGFLYQSSQIASHAEFQEMVDEWAGLDPDDPELLALETYWAAEQGLVSARVTKPFDPALVEEGAAVSENYCAECHAPASGAPVSFTLAKLVGPIGAAVGDNPFTVVLGSLHLLFCFGLLAWLPFSKMFHVIAAPVSLLINGVAGFKNPAPDAATALNRQMIGLSACTHCGACSERCSSLTFYESFANDFILPSEKVQYLQRIASGKSLDHDTLKQLQKGLYICTSCDRCSEVCPSGINLRELFTHARYYLLSKNVPETSILSHFSFPLSLLRTFGTQHLRALKTIEQRFKTAFAKLSELGSITLNAPAEVGANNYLACYSCQRCTNICPVVRGYDNPQETLDLLPHQIIFSLGIGNKDLAMGARMLWSCSTCYLCQEHCPNNVALTDIFYHLKNGALHKLEAGGTA